MKSKLYYSLLLFSFFLKGYSINTPFTVALKIDGTALVTIGSLSGGDTWQFEYGASGFAEGTGTLSNFSGYNTISYKLDPFQTWDFRVRKKYLSFPAGEWSQVETLNNSCTSSPHYVGYLADFDSDPVQQCWRGYKSNITSTSVQINIENQNYDGNTGKSIAMYCGSAYTAMLVSPRLEDLASDKKIKFWLKGNGNSGQIRVGTITNPYDPTTFHELASYTGIGSTAFIQKTILFNDYNGADKYIAFKLKVDFSAEACLIDQFSYEQSINCIPAGNFNVSNITEHSAQMNFDTSGQTNWELNVKNMLTSQVQTITINNGNYVLNNLTGNTSYQVKLRANCGDGIYSPWTTLNSFTTPCENITPGYYTGFDESSYLNPCWSKIISNTYYNVNLTTSTAAASDGKYLTFQGSTNSTTYKTILVTPYVSELNNTKRVRFKILDNKRADFLAFPFTIGTLSNPTDASTFTPMVTLNPLDVNPIGVFELGSFWQQYIVDFTNYYIPLNNHYIAFRIDGYSNASAFAQNIFFDDFYFEEIPQCKEPTNIQVLSYDYDKATISWNSASDASSWQVEYGPSGFTPGTGTYSAASSSPFTLNNLISDTNYDFYVKSVCSGSNSLPSCKGNFKTRCSGVTVGYTTSFETETFDPNATCWRRVCPRLRDYYYSPNWFINMYANGQFSSQNAHTGTKLIAMRGGNDSPDSNEQNKTILVTPRLLDLDNSKQINFWVYCQNNPYSTLQQIVVGTLSNPDDYNTFTPFQVITAPFTLAEWRKFNVDFSSYYGTDKYVGIKQTSSTGNYVLFVDDFEYIENPCRRPTNLMASQSGQNSATLSWNSNVSVDASSTWQIEYGELGFTPGAGTLLTVNTNPLVINNLEVLKKYQFRIRNICSNNYTNWSDLYPFKITCLVNAPFYENFDQYESNVGYPYLDPTLCWTSANAINAAIYVFSQNNINSAPNVGFVESNNNVDGMFISPYLVDFDNTKRIRFWAKLQVPTSTQNLSLIIGTIKNPLDSSTFVPFQTIPMNPTYQSGQQFMVDFSSYTGDSKHLAFKTTGYFSDGGYTTNRIFFDDIYYETIPTCSQPLDINFSQTNDNSALLKWTNVGSSQSTRIEYGITGFSQGTGIVLNSNAEQILITGLLPTTNYDFYVTSICSSESSLVFGPVRIRTTCVPASIPWLEDLNGLSQYGLNILPFCFKKTGADIISRNTPFDNSSFNTFGPDHYLTGYNDTSFLYLDSYTGLFSPMFHLEAGTTYRYSLKARKSYEYNFANIKVSAYRGQETYFQVSDMEKNGILSEYEYDESYFFYTPIDTGDYSFLMVYDMSGGQMITDNFELQEGYPNPVVSDRLFNFDQGIDSALIVENTNNAKIILTSIQGNNVLKMSGSNSNVFSTSSDIWIDNQNSISKVNFKINSSSFTTLFLSFKLKQTYSQNAIDSAFRLIVNGNVIGGVIHPTTTNLDVFQSYEFDLTPYLNQSDLRISLQHIGKSSTGNADNAYLDDIKVNTITTLINSQIEINNLVVYPNPTTSKVFISCQENISNIKVYNLWGQKLQETGLDSNQTSIDLSSYTSGIYFINIQSGDKNKNIKILKE